MASSRRRHGGTDGPTGMSRSTNSLRRAAPVIGLAEAPLRIAPSDIGLRRRALRLAATTAAGFMMPAGFEKDLEAEVRETTREAERLASVDAVGEMRRLTGASAHVTVLARLDAADGRAAQNGIVALINNDPSSSQPIPVSLDPLDPAAGALLGNPRTVAGEPLPDRLAPGEIRVALVSRIDAVREGKRPDRRTASAAALRPPVVIERVTPQVSGGPFASKRIIGRPITVEADIFADGHDELAAELLWRAVGREGVAARTAGADRQRSLARRPVAQAHRPASVHDRGMARRIRDPLPCAGGEASRRHRRRHRDRRCARASGSSQAQPDPEGIVRAAMSTRTSRLLTGTETRRQVAEVDDRALANRPEPIAVEVERPQAEFASWYELFPRSARARFDDVIRPCRASATWASTCSTSRRSIRSARTNRKGRNNTPDAGPGRSRQPLCDRRRRGRPRRDPSGSSARSRISAGWSPRRAEHGLEIALDFAIQCSPDHPWLKQHPDWFAWRADGTIRYAENPPKKYEDIVNVDFYAEGAMPGPVAGAARRRAVLGRARACASSASTIRTPSRCRSGNG